MARRNHLLFFWMGKHSWVNQSSKFELKTVYFFKATQSFCKLAVRKCPYKDNLINGEIENSFIEIWKWNEFLRLLRSFLFNEVEYSKTITTNNVSAIAKVLIFKLSCHYKFRWKLSFNCSVTFSWLKILYANSAKF